ncbi:hypothetical protein K488DRAFT_89176 [Vararia minispora EC-137]|uniref:Uncharacterized protein n=1 Tax=Vararia minispora EC-137 TaxID=1314806 RepID=A0ACB8QBK7_9AGAM|nr:hypothetical protein K488DRAFT_89176 [Vararia minispora EC-137]
MNFITSGAARSSRVSVQAIQSRSMASSQGYRHMPFKHETIGQFNRRYIPFMVLGSVIPFAACYWKIWRTGV